MGRPTTTSADTRRKLVVAATGLFAEAGYKSVSIRDVARAAGVNSALINYHFGGKDGLFVEVIRVVSARHVAERMHRLSMARMSGTTLDLEGLLRIYLEPLLGPEVWDAPQRQFARLHAWMISERSEVAEDIAVRAFNTVNAAFIDEITQCLPHLTREVVIWRFYSMIGTLLFLNISPSPPGLASISGGRCNSSDSREVLRQLMPWLIAAFSAPMPEPGAASAAAAQGEANSA